METRKDRKNEKLKISIEALSKTCAHEDLITTIDVCVQSGLIVTGRLVWLFYSFLGDAETFGEFFKFKKY